MKFKTVISSWGGVFLTLSLSLFTGCGTKDIIQPVKNAKIETNSLYIGSFNNISNTTSNSSFRLNDYQPIGYDTETYDKKMSSIFFKDETNNKYEFIECKNKPIDILAKNIIFAPFLSGINLLVGGICVNRHSFDYEEFDKDAKRWVTDNNINRHLILVSYSSLVTVQLDKEKQYKNFTTKQNSILNDLYTKYSKKYSNHPTIKKYTKDLSSLYKKEPLSSNVTLIENKLQNKDIPIKISYQKEVSSSFPCKSTSQCNSNIKKSINTIDEKFSNDMKKLQEASTSTIANYERYLQKETDTISVEYPKNLQTDTFKDKTIHYMILSNETINSKAKKVDVTYEIIDIDYKNVYPSFKNKNKELSINFDPKTKILTYTNLTSKSLQLNSIDLYYGNNIYTITDNKNLNYSANLAPEAYKTMKLTQTIKESSYKNITKKKALAKKIEFGLSVKYTIGDSTKNRTLSKRNKMNLYSIIN